MGYYDDENPTYGYFGIGGFALVCVANFNEARVELSMGKAEREINKEAFDYLYSHKADIEAALDRAVIWRRNDEGRNAQVVISLENISLEQEADWTQMAKFHAEWSKKFYDVLVPYLKEKY